jgi:hypothetical protein
VEANGSNPQKWHHDVFSSRELTALGSLQIDVIKQRAAVLLAEIDSIKPVEGNETPHDCHRLVALSKRDLESAVMWAVKAISRT